PENKSVQRDAAAILVKDDGKSGPSYEKVIPKGSDSSFTSTENSQPVNSCCCRTAIANESDTSISTIPICGCSANCGAPSEPSVSEPSPISFFTGRPTPRIIIRKELENALGESAVV